MAKLTTTKRAKLPDETFALPGQRKYPLDTKPRAQNALGRATQQVNAGNLSPTAAARIRAKARVVLGK